MWLRPAISLLMLAAILAVTSVTSAAMMAPDREKLALDAFKQAYGIAQVSDDFCGDPAGPVHHCPFCHALPEAPETGHQAIVFLLTPHDGWRLHDDLIRAAQARNRNHSPRAPPVRA